MENKQIMDKKKSIKLTKFEMEIMHALWELGRASIREIQESLPDARRPAYTTVQTIVRRLEDKGAVQKVKKIGNAFIFEPVVTQKAALHRLVDELLGFFGGSARPLMAHLAEAGKLDLEDLQELESLITEQEENGERKNAPGEKGHASSGHERSRRSKP